MIFFLLFIVMGTGLRKALRSFQNIIFDSKNNKRDILKSRGLIFLPFQQLLSFHFTFVRLIKIFAFQSNRPYHLIGIVNLIDEPVTLLVQTDAESSQEYC